MEKTPDKVDSIVNFKSELEESSYHYDSPKEFEFDEIRERLHKVRRMFPERQLKLKLDNLQNRRMRDIEEEKARDMKKNDQIISMLKWNEEYGVIEPTDIKNKKQKDTIIQSASFNKNESLKNVKDLNSLNLESDVTYSSNIETERSEDYSLKLLANNKNYTNFKPHGESKFELRQDVVYEKSNFPDNNITNQRNNDNCKIMSKKSKYSYTSDKLNNNNVLKGIIKKDCNFSKPNINSSCYDSVKNEYVQKKDHRFQITQSKIESRSISIETKRLIPEARHIKSISRYNPHKIKNVDSTAQICSKHTKTKMNNISSKHINRKNLRTKEICESNPIKILNINPFE